MKRLRHIAFLLAVICGVMTASGAAPVAPGDTAATPRRPRVAVVLAGGGAKGVAHITALRVVEQAGIPIDMVVGNSMGSLIGGLYSAGYTTDELQHLVSTQDWMQLLLDNPNYGRRGLGVKKQNERYLLQLPIAQGTARHSGARASGVLEGGNVIKLLRDDLLHGLPDSIDFNTLPYPFACVATEAQTGDVHEFHSGDLVMAMRASMAIPGAFTPVRSDPYIFVDGGVTNNFPVDVAVRMGADVIIGLDLVTGQTAAQLTENAVDLITHLYDVAADPLYRANIRACDVYIPLDVSGYSASSFTPSAIDTLLLRGERSARLYYDTLLALKTGRLGLDAGYRPVPPAPIDSMRYWSRADQAPADGADATAGTLRKGIDELRRTYMSSYVQLGARFDNYEHASLLVGVQLALSQKYNASLSARLRLGQRMRFDAYLHYRLWGLEDVNLGYEWERDEPSYYWHGSRMASLTTMHNAAQLHLGHTSHHWDYRFGLRYDTYAIDDILLGSTAVERLPQAFGVRHERYFTYFAQGEFNTLNTLYLPTAGTHVELRGELISDNLYDYDGQKLVPVVSLHFQKPVTMGSRFTLSPLVQARFAFFDASTPFTLINYVGGLFRQQLAPHQLTMAGLPFPEVMPDFYLSAGLRAQQRIGQNHFVTLAVDGATASDHARDLGLREANFWGFNFGYAFRSAAGPLSVGWYWSDRTKSLAALVNLGYCF